MHVLLQTLPRLPGKSEAQLCLRRISGLQNAGSTTVGRPPEGNRSGNVDFRAAEAGARAMCQTGHPENQVAVDIWSWWQQSPSWAWCAMKMTIFMTSRPCKVRYFNALFLSQQSPILDDEPSVIFSGRRGVGESCVQHFSSQARKIIVCVDCSWVFDPEDGIVAVASWCLVLDFVGVKITFGSVS